MKEQERLRAENCCLAVKLPVPEGWEVPEHLKSKAPQAVPPVEGASTPFVKEYWLNLLTDEALEIFNKLPKTREEKEKIRNRVLLTGDATQEEKDIYNLFADYPHPVYIWMREFLRTEEELQKQQEEFLSLFERAKQGDPDAIGRLGRFKPEDPENQKPHPEGFPKSLLDAWKERLSRYSITFLGFYAYPREVPESTAELLMLENDHDFSSDGDDLVQAMDEYYKEPKVSLDEIDAHLHTFSSEELSEKKFLYADEWVKREPWHIISFFPNPSDISAGEYYYPKFILVDYSFDESGKLNSFTFRPIGTRALYRIDIENPVGSVVKSFEWRGPADLAKDTISFEFADKDHEDLLRTLVQYRVPVGIDLIPFREHFNGQVRFLEQDPSKMVFFFDYKAYAPDNILVTARGGDFEFVVGGYSPDTPHPILPEVFLGVHELDKYHPELRGQLQTPLFWKKHPTVQDRKQWGWGALGIDEY
ncbi:MAG: hypothetical protein BLITH_1417 [Brockia lithotrophica]|uniref:Uncharacterized protein n=1 Tax=Brockia lithotrophica TaxID=933949 RepID=A0A2T5G3W3_9BACL|nr:MAG: hypothetical protein BLITH_1417 [Brockia lithotrophica]